jgi:hypothetical protein
MLETALVWVLMTSQSFGSGMVSYSPPVKTVEDCRRMHTQLVPMLKSQSKCVQINMVFPVAKPVERLNQTPNSTQKK